MTSSAWLGGFLGSGHRSWASRLAALLLLACAWGCAGSQATSPRAAVSAYARALEDGRLEEAYALLSDETRQDLSYSDFERMVEENPEEVAALVDALESKTEGSRVTATVVTPDGQELELLYENGAWRIQESAVDLWPRDTPRRALDTFVRAFDAKRYDILMEFVPDEHREGLSPELLQTAWEGEQKLEMERITEGLRASLPSAEIETVGDRATMSYGALGAVELVREHGAWKIEGFQ